MNQSKTDADNTLMNQSKLDADNTLMNQTKLDADNTLMNQSKLTRSAGKRVRAGQDNKFWLGSLSRDNKMVHFSKAIIQWSNAKLEGKRITFEPK